MTERNAFPPLNLPVYLPEGALTAPQYLCSACGLKGERAANVYRMAAENRLFCASLRGLEAALQQGRIIESTVVLCDCQTMALTVELCGGIRGVIPREEVLYAWDGKPIRDIAAITRVGKQIQCKVTRIARNERGEITAYLSRRAAQRECVERYLLSCRPGDLLPVRVTHLEPFGAFVDIGCGIISLIPIDAISVSRISHPRDRFHAGQFLPALIRQADFSAGRITLTHKELLGTWEENAAMFAPLQTVPGIVRSVEEYGVFVELTPNLAGLAEYRDDVSPGDGCSVYIKSITPERMKVKLVLIDTCMPGDADTPLHYRLPEAGHIDLWQYSPECCLRRIVTDFAREGDPLRREEARCC